MDAKDASPLHPRDQESERTSGSSILSQLFLLPNLLTLLRLAAVPLFLWAYVTDRAGLALVLFVGAAVTDVLDGFLARALDLRSYVGGILDPVADKLLNLAALAALSVDHYLPLWLLGLVLLRDGSMALAVVILRARGGRIPAAPSRMGKYATLLLAVTMTLALVERWTGEPSLTPWLVATTILAAQCVLVSYAQYFLRWVRLMRALPPSA